MPCQPTLEREDGQVVEAEYGDLLAHLREQVRALGRPDLDDRLLDSRRLDDQRSASGDVESYLLALRTEFVLGSEETRRETVRLFERVQTETGRPITGIVIDVQPEDRAALGVDRVDLIGSPALDALIEQLDAILDEVAQDRRS